MLCTWTKLSSNNSAGSFSLLVKKGGVTGRWVPWKGGVPYQRHEWWNTEPRNCKGDLILTALFVGWFAKVHLSMEEVSDCGLQSRKTVNATSKAWDGRAHRSSNHKWGNSTHFPIFWTKKSETFIKIQVGGRADILLFFKQYWSVVSIECCNSGTSCIILVISLGGKVEYTDSARKKELGKS